MATPRSGLYAITIFAAALLLFEVQPMIGRMVLPWFGGSAAVWTTCLLFFQSVLLLGYLYVHWSVSTLSPRRQSWLHLTLLAGSLLALPLTLNAAWKPTGTEDPALRILAVLASSIGLPYFLLSTTGPLLQAWYAAERSHAAPYRLFALSNLGSMLALLSYPALVEPNLTLQRQSAAWSVGYVLFAVSCGCLAWHAARRPVYRLDPDRAPQGPPIRLLGLWAFLAFCPSVLLAAVTAHLTQNVAPIPFLWVLPLTLYLLSFILCFESARWYKRWLFLPLFAVALAAMAFAVLFHEGRSSLLTLIALFSGSLFVVSMTCHGELAGLKPNARHLTTFYLMIAAGGMLGGIFVGLIAPRVFNAYHELPIGLVLSALSVVLALDYVRTGWLHRGRIKIKWALLLALVLGLIGPLVREAAAVRHEVRLMARNFYGTLTVKDAGTGASLARKLYHGSIIHGMQLLSADYRRIPTTYYTQRNGVGIAILGTRSSAPQRVGVIGLGAGTLAAYGRAGDTYRFYEVNPLVITIAQGQFWFLRDSPARTEIALGDARLSLEREPPQRFDVLVVDAFSGDSIPVHLLTKEAFALYFHHLKPEGVMAVHVSNKFLDLAPVVKAAADAFGKQAKVIDTEDDGTGVSYGAKWVLVSDSPRVSSREQPAPVARFPSRTGVWTDDFASVYPILR